MSAATIQAIETRYRGYRFRSRLEARWAVAFEQLGCQWTYEVEGFRLPSGAHYLPDFGVELSVASAHPLWFFVEVKGNLAEFVGWDRLWEFASYSPLLILENIPDPQPGAPSALFPLLRAQHHRRVDWIWFQGGGKAGILPASDHPSAGFRVASESRAEQAFFAARGARFEHGERPLS